MGIRTAVTRANKVDSTSLTESYGRFTIEPLERGFGITIGNSLRRVLLSSIPGAAVTSVRIDGVLHEYTTIPGVLEDVLSIILNIKGLRVRMRGDEPRTLLLDVSGPCDVKASHIQAPPEVEIVNPDLHIATLSDTGILKMEMEVERGKGYMPAERNRKEGQPIGTIPVDAIFSPVKRVSYKVEEMMVGYETGYERLIMEIWTDGSIDPKEALKKATEILIDQFEAVASRLEGVEEREIPMEEVLGREGDVEEELERKRRLLSARIEELDLPARVVNNLKKMSIERVGDLVAMTEKDVKKLKNFGKKSFEDVKKVLEGLGLSFGMDVDRYIGRGKDEALKDKGEAGEDHFSQEGPAEEPGDRALQAWADKDDVSKG
jgi:DNA-directed RNA polymerase subunit alpha